MVTGSCSIRALPSGSRWTSWWVRKRSSSRAGKSVRWWAPRDSSRRSPDSRMHSATSSRLASSSAATSSVLNDPLVSRMPTRSIRSCSPRSRSPPVGHVRTGAVDAGGLLHRRLHLVADGRDAVVPRRRVHQPPDPAGLVVDLRLRRAGGGLAGRGGVLRGGPARAGAEDQALGQRVGAEPVGAVDGHARGLAGGVQAAERAWLRRCRCGRRPSCSARPGRTGISSVHRVDPLVLQAQLADERDPGLDQLLAEVAQVEVRRSGRTASPIVRPFSISATNACESRSRGPSSMLRSSGVGVGLPRS